MTVLLASLWFLLGSLLPPSSPMRMIRDSQEKEWDHKRLWRIFLITLAINVAFTPSCILIPAFNNGLVFSAILQVLFLIRLAVARMRHEKGATWIFYAVLIWMSPFWIPLIVNTRYGFIK